MLRLASIEAAWLPLRPRSVLGVSGTAEPRASLLLRLRFDDGLVGHAGLFAWPSLGDPPLRTVAFSLRDGEPHALAARAIETARADGEARAAGRSCFEGLEVPRSHALLTSLDATGLRRAPGLLEAGFDTLKIKIGRDPEEEARYLAALVEAHPSLGLRLDANGRFEAEGFDRWWAGLAAPTRAAVELVEDPCPFDPERWSNLSAPLAWDRGCEALPERHDELVRAGLELSAIVVKPALQAADPLADLAAKLGIGVVVTSYLGPALEAAAAAWTAGRLLRAHPDTIRTCGLCSHTAYEPDAWSSELAVKDARLVPPSGTGLGFDGLLATTKWRELEELPWS